MRVVDLIVDVVVIRRSVDVVPAQGTEKRKWVTKEKASSASQIVLLSANGLLTLTLP